MNNRGSCIACSKRLDDTEVVHEHSIVNPTVGIGVFLRMCDNCWSNMIMSQPIKVQITGPIPTKANPDDACFDLKANEDYDLPPSLVTAIGTGISVAVPAGYEMQIRPRSGIALKSSITVMNAPGTIDAGYRGEIKVILINHGSDVYRVRIGDRIAQCCFAPVIPVQFDAVPELTETQRGTGGFGSSGK